MSWTATRRQFLGAAGLGAAAAVLPACTTAPSVAAGAGVSTQSDLIRREIPGTGESVNVIGLGTFMTFDTVPEAPLDHLREVMRRYWEAGGRVVDTSPLYGAAESNVATIASELNIRNEMFVTNKVWATGGYLWDDSVADQSLANSATLLSDDGVIEAIQCHNLVNVDCHIPLFHAWKQEGRIRYLGATHHDLLYYPALARWVENGDLDFVQVRYSMSTRQAEERILPAAADNGVGVLVCMPLEKARLHGLVGDRPLPDFALEFGMQTWSEFFLKWVVSHPGVTCALPATTNPDHLLENVAAMRGPLPDARMRDQMLRHMESIPGFDQLESMPWYPGKTFDGLISRAQAATRRRSPWWPS
ncbi:aryl-alcohol dehydrogenase-like predicted oxidoreductase [Pseudonocardia kunmingensis]|uniref:Aryl-alcohol dehydrogenase-like predicted oxidoreductase n=1 Tax=Pseudonocardia kunmingensis TaxID=630975 RepID=A0A543DQ74_9PSEU|nr:aryl-alcohol dehydrogenase-like predicted oxidoreductase [Pseudonocardia kunmingensis]